MCIRQTTYYGVPWWTDKENDTGKLQTSGALFMVYKNPVTVHIEIMIIIVNLDNFIDAIWFNTLSEACIECGRYVLILNALLLFYVDLKLTLICKCNLSRYVYLISDLCMIIVINQIILL